VDSLVDYLNVKSYDLQEVNVTTRREIYHEHIRFLVFPYIKEGVTL
jgi:hypothetical protein